MPDPTRQRPRVSGGARRSAGETIENYPAYASLCCGVACLVPWVIVIVFPPALVLGVVGLVKSTRLPDGQGRSAALIGIGMALAAAALQLAIVGLAGIIGFL